MLNPCDTDITNKLGVLLTHAGQLYQRKANALLRPLGLTETQCKILFGVLLLNKDLPKVRQNDLIKYLNLNKAAASHVIKHLVQKGYIERSADAEDSRVKTLFVTPIGQELLLAAKPKFEAVDKELAALLGEEFPLLCRLLIKIISQDCPEHKPCD